MCSESICNRDQCEEKGGRCVDHVSGTVCECKKGLEEICDSSRFVDMTHLVDVCARDCSGRGICVDGNCKCEIGFSGEYCQVELCPLDCGEHGECNLSHPQYPGCFCELGWAGPGCSKPACPLNCSYPLKGSCGVDGICKCLPGFEGDDCVLETCPNQCSGNGFCSSDGCICYEGFAGPDCSEGLFLIQNSSKALLHCVDLNCSSNGVCVQGECICDDGFIGHTCEHTKCPNDCSGHGECHPDGYCECYLGFSGISCENFSPSICMTGCEISCTVLRDGSTMPGKNHLKHQCVDICIATKCFE